MFFEGSYKNTNEAVEVCDLRATIIPRRDYVCDVRMDGTCLSVVVISEMRMYTIPMYTDAVCSSRIYAEVVCAEVVCFEVIFEIG